MARAGQARARARRRRASRPTTARASTSPTTCASPTARPARRRRGGTGCATGARCSARSTRSTRARACCSAGPAGPASRRSASPGAATRRRTSGRCARSSRATLTAAASGFSNWSHDVGGYLGEQLDGALPEGAARALGAVRLLHAADARARALRAGGVDVRRGDAARSTASTCCCTSASCRTCARPRRPRRAAGCRSSARWRCSTRADARGWAVADAYGYGPSLWVAPVLEAGAREREVDLPRGDWIDYWTGEEVAGGGEVVAPAPLDRIPVWVRRGALIVTYPAEHVAARARRHAGARAPARGDAVGRAAVRPRAAAARRRHGRALVERGEWSVTPERARLGRLAEAGNLRPTGCSHHSAPSATTIQSTMAATLPLQPPPAAPSGLRPRLRVTLGDGARTTVHVAAYDSERTEVRVALLARPAAARGLVRGERRRTDAIVGGFFVRPDGAPLGEVRTHGVRRRHVPFAAPWDRRARVRARRRRQRAHRAARRASRRAARRPPAGRPAAGARRAAGVTTARRTPRASGAAHDQFDSDITRRALPARRARHRRPGGCSPSRSTAAGRTTPG